jgi:hypothetical protein
MPSFCGIVASSRSVRNIQPALTIHIVQFAALLRDRRVVIDPKSRQPVTHLGPSGAKSHDSSCRNNPAQRQ